MLQKETYRDTTLDGDLDGAGLDGVGLDEAGTLALTSFEAGR
jgi:hypothetical protein